MNTNKINFEYQGREDLDGETWTHYMRAERGEIVAVGHGGCPETAKIDAERKLIEKEKSLSPKSPGWENSIESFLCRSTALFN